MTASCLFIETFGYPTLEDETFNASDSLNLNVLLMAHKVFQQDKKWRSRVPYRFHVNFYANNGNELVLVQAKRARSRRNWTALSKQANIMKFNIRLKARVDNRSIVVRAYESKYRRDCYYLWCTIYYTGAYWSRWPWRGVIQRAERLVTRTGERDESRLIRIFLWLVYKSFNDARLSLECHRNFISENKQLY